VSAYCSGRDAGGHDADESRLNASYQENIMAASEKDCEWHLNLCRNAGMEAIYFCLFIKYKLILTPW
jgi:hypothetical protein